MTPPDTIGRARTGPADHRHNTEILDAITGISAVSALPADGAAPEHPTDAVLGLNDPQSQAGPLAPRRGGRHLSAKRPKLFLDLRPDPRLGINDLAHLESLAAPIRELPFPDVAASARIAA